tara:strand:- start:1433 stop:2299 length:867 start_codon:yes stop_codon:yes gene_type:complete
MKKYKNLNEAFVMSLKHVQDCGDRVQSRGTNQKEALFYSMCIEDPTDLSIEVPARRFNPDYATTEWLWYLSRNPSVNNIGKLANIWLKIQDDDGNCESNYGSYLLGDQWTWALEELLKDPDSRRATLAINQPYHKGKNNADYPCTQYIHFFIRENRLHLGVHMRSNDAVFGFCNDVFTFCLFQQLMKNDYNNLIKAQGSARKPIELGRYYHSADSFHVYENHWNMMDKILNNYYVKKMSSGFPTTLNKFKLNDNITSSFIDEISLPTIDMKKSEINLFVNNTKEFLYA